MCLRSNKGIECTIVGMIFASLLVNCSNCSIFVEDKEYCSNKCENYNNDTLETIKPVS